MKRTFLVLCAAFAFGSVGMVGAQYGGGQSTSSKSSSHSEKSRDVTLTGCLEQGSSPDTFVLRNASESSMPNSGGSSSEMSGSSSTSGGSSQGTSGSGQSTTGSEQTGTSGQSGTSMSQSPQSGMDFQLVGKSKDLKRYVGQRVEIKGKVEPLREGESGQSSGSYGGSTSGSTSGTAGTSGSTSGSTGGETQSTTGGSTSGQSTSAGAVTHRVKVSSVKQLGSSCQ